MVNDTIDARMNNRNPFKIRFMNFMKLVFSASGSYSGLFRKWRKSVSRVI